MNSELEVRNTGPTQRKRPGGDGLVRSRSGTRNVRGWLEFIQSVAPNLKHQAAVDILYAGKFVLEQEKEQKFHSKDDDGRRQRGHKRFDRDTLGRSTGAARMLQRLLQSRSHGDQRVRLMRESKTQRGLSMQD